MRSLLTNVTMAWVATTLGLLFLTFESANQRWRHRTVELTFESANQRGRLRAVELTFESANQRGRHGAVELTFESANQRGRLRAVELTFESANQCGRHRTVELIQHLVARRDDRVQTLGGRASHLPRHVVVIAVLVVALSETHN